MRVYRTSHERRFGASRARGGERRGTERHGRPELVERVEETRVAAVEMLEHRAPDGDLGGDGRVEPRMPDDGEGGARVVRVAALHGFVRNGRRAGAAGSVVERVGSELVVCRGK